MALLEYDPSSSGEDNARLMEEAAHRVRRRRGHPRRCGRRPVPRERSPWEISFLAFLPASSPSARVSPTRRLVCSRCCSGRATVRSPSSRVRVRPPPRRARSPNGSAWCIPRSRWSCTPPAVNPSTRTSCSPCGHSRRRSGAELPAELRDLPLRVDTARHVHRPGADAPRAAGQNFLCDPATGKIRSL